MSDYKTHSKFNAFIALPLSLTLLYFWKNPDPKYLGVFSGFFLYSTLFMNPDLDLVHQIKIFSIRGFLSLPFRFYSLIFKRRGLSHHILFGTLTRIFWLFGIYLLILYAIYQNIDGYQKFTYYLLKNKELSLYSFGGIVVADWSHLLLDYVPKRKRFRL